MNWVSFLELGDVAVENIEEIYFVMSFISLSNVTTVYPSFSIKSRTCTSSLSLSGIRSCSRRMEPGTSRFLMRLIIFSGVGCRVSSVRMFQPMGMYPSLRTALARVGLVTPKGGRNHRTG